jgi:hypothetical protein
MKMKFTWGTALFTIILLFILAVVFFFTFSSRQDYPLVEEDYYEKELRYQERIDQIKNTAELADKIRCTRSGDTLLVSYPDFFPEDQQAGLLHFYRPSDSRLDERMKMIPGSSRVQIISLQNFSKGKYILKMEWTMNGKGFYQEEVLILP